MSGGKRNHEDVSDTMALVQAACKVLAITANQGYLILCLSSKLMSGVTYHPLPAPSSVPKLLQAARSRAGRLRNGRALVCVLTTTGTDLRVSSGTTSDTAPSPTESLTISAAGRRGPNSLRTAGGPKTHVSECRHSDRWYRSGRLHRFARSFAGCSGRQIVRAANDGIGHHLFCRTRSTKPEGLPLWNVVLVHA